MIIETWLHQDINEPVKVNYLNGNLFTNNGNGNQINVILTSNGQAVSVSGTVSGYVVTADGSTVPCTGSKSGNRASILIPAAAYQPGPIFITVFVTDGTQVTTIGAVSSTVLSSRTNAQVDPGSVVTDWTQTINAAMQAVQTAAANLANIVAVPYASITFPVPLGKYTVYNDNLYRCITPIASSESFTAAHWTQVRLGDDVSELKSALKNEDNGISTLDLYASFVRGGLTNGVVNPDIYYRVTTDDIIKFDRGITLNIASGYRIALHYFSGTTYTSGTGWRTTRFYVPANTGFKILIAKVTETITQADVSEFVHSITFTSNNEERLTDAEESEIISDSVAYLKKWVPTLDARNFANGSLDSNGNIQTETVYRVCNAEIQYNGYDSIFKSETGYKFAFHFFNSSGERTGVTEYINANTIYYMPGGTYYKMLIVKEQEDTSVIADIETFVSKVAMKTAVFAEDGSMYKEIYDSLVLNRSKFIYDTFYVGNHTNGIPSSTGAIHVCSLSMFSFPIKVRLDIKDGYQFAVNYFNNDGTFAVGTGWKKSEEIAANQKFRILISEVPNTYTATEADIEPRVSAITITGIPTEYEYSYDGDALDLNTNGFNVSQFWANYTGFPDGVNRAAQGCAVFDDVLFSGFTNGSDRTQKMRSYNAKTGELYGTFDIVGGHLGSIAFSDEYYDPEDDFPLLYSDDDVYPCQISVNRVTRTSATLIRTLVLDEEHGGYYAKIALDNTEHRLWSIGQETNDITQAGTMLVNAWDLDNLVDNGDGTYTPTLIPELGFEITGVFNQTAAWLNGKIYYLLSSYTDVRHTGILVIDPYTKRIAADLENWPSEIKNAEMEGIAFIPNAKRNKYEMLFTTHGLAVYKVAFS